MKKVVLIPDSFKGTLSSAQICDIMEQNVKKHFPECEVVKIPVADGGEGSVNCFLTAAGGEKRKVIVKKPYMEDMEAFYGILPDKTAVIEMAACAGLPLVENRQNPEVTTTYGVGQLMLDAVEHGCKKIVVGLGGSCTNDAGAGAAAAVGVEFFDKDGEKLIPTGGTLGKVAKISMENMDERIKSAQIITMCDIDNPMYGKSGAAYIFGPQKGADDEMVQRLDANLRKFDSKLQMGIETVLDIVKFDELIQGADLIFTGEGKMDSQSLRGKVVIGVGKRAKRQDVPVVVVTGDAEEVEDAYDMGISAVFSTNRVARDFSVIRYKSKEYMEVTMDNIMRLIKIVNK